MEKKRILVIDDNTVNLATIEKGLSEKFEIVPMISGKRALKYLYYQRVDMILLDVEMPEMNGVETLTEIRNLENCANVPVAFCTAKKDKITVMEGFRLGIMDYITKPFDVDDVASRIDYCLKRVGKLPFEKKEMYSILNKMIGQVENNDWKSFLALIKEAQSYQADEEITGRLKAIQQKIVARDMEGAVGLLRRTHRMLETELGEQAVANLLSRDKLEKMIKDVLEDIDNFRTKEAIAKCKALQEYELEKKVADAVEESVRLLGDYDDEQAEKVLKNLLEMI